MLNEQLKLIRKANKYTQQQISDLLEIDRSTYASYETGRNRPDIRFLAAFAKVFDITVDYLIGIDPKSEFLVCDSVVSLKKEQGETLISELKRDEKDLLAMYRMCSSEKKENFMELLKQAKNEELNNSL